jgi:hypothetical protein
MSGSWRQAKPPGCCLLDVRVRPSHAEHDDDAFLGAEAAAVCSGEAGFSFTPLSDSQKMPWT